MNDREFASSVFSSLDLGNNFNIEFYKKLVRAYRLKLEEIFNIPAEKLYPEDRLAEFMHHTKRDWDFLEIIFCLEEILEIPVDVIYNFDCKLSIGKWLIDLFIEFSQGSNS